MTGPICPFCKLVEENQAIVGNQYAQVIYNHAPLAQGHVMVIPTRHINTLEQMEESEAMAFFGFALAISRQLMDYYHAPAYNWTLQNGIAAGQTVPHLHLHILMRYNTKPDPGDAWYSLLNGTEQVADSAHRPKLSMTEHQNITATLRRFLNKEL